ncbi:MAG: tyrosine--tRNA ligase, partial [Bacteroidales bacterium]|nr:tyrosine--tRNA ligase [Bacteroidales bacterium]
TGTELIRRKTDGEAFALTCPLITKADGGKFGKTEKGNIWLDPERTSPYIFYQFWLNCSDEDSKKYIRIFTLYSKEEIEAMEKEQEAAPHLRTLQKALAKDLTVRVHSQKDYEAAVEASNILFGKGTHESLAALSEQMFLSVFDGVPTFNVSRTLLETGISPVELLTEHAAVFASKGEIRRLIKEGGLSINKIKADENTMLTTNDIINRKYLLVQKGKKNYYVIVIQ